MADLNDPLDPENFEETEDTSSNLQDRAGDLVNTAKSNVADRAKQAVKRTAERTINATKQAAKEAIKKATQAVMRFLKEVVWNAIRQIAASIVAALGWEVIIPAIIIIAVVIIAVIIFLAASSCSGGRCSPDTPTGTAEDNRQTTKILALADPKKNTKLIATEGNDIIKSTKIVESRLKESLAKETDPTKKTEIQNGINIINNELYPLLDQAILSQGTDSSSNDTVLRSLCDSIAVAAVRLIYNFGGAVIATNNGVETSLPISPVAITGFGKSLHGYSQYNNSLITDHNVYKSIYNPQFQDQGKYVDAIDAAVPKDTPVYSPLTGIAFVYDRGTPQERVEIITETGDSFALLSQIKTNKSQNRFVVNAGEIIGSINDLGQLHFQLTIKDNYFSRTSAQEGDESLWINMMVNLTGQQADPASVQRIQGSITSIFK